MRAFMRESWNNLAEACCMHACMYITVVLHTMVARLQGC
jgi:hypothetical protein